MIRLRLSAFLMAAALLAGCSSNKVLGPPYCPNKEAPAGLAASTSASGPLHQTALAYDRFYQGTLRPRPHGGLVNVIFPHGSTAQPVGYDDQKNSAIWTGAYLAAEAFRYASTQDPEEKREALENARGAAKTLDLFLKVTGSRNILARFAGPLDETSVYLSGWDPGKCEKVQTLDQAHVCCKANDCFVSDTMGDLFWLGSTSRDQYTGWFFGMGIAYRLIDDPDLRQMIRDDVKTLITSLRARGWVIHAPDQGLTAGIVEPMQQLAWLLIVADVLGSEGCAWYEEKVREVWPVVGSSIENDFNWTNRYMQYYGFNLAFMNFYHLIQLEPNPHRRNVYLDSLKRHTYPYVEKTDNVFFHYITLAVKGTAQTWKILDRGRKVLGEFPSIPTRAACVMPPKAQLSKASIDLYRLDKDMFHPQAEHPYPFQYWCRQDFIWQQTPYAICCCPASPGQSWPPLEYQESCKKQPSYSQDKDLYYPGVDYLVAYWMGRYHGFLSPED